MASKKKASNKKQQVQETKKQSTDSFPSKTFVLFLTFGILGGVVYSDIQTSGSWKNSSTARLLHRYHVCEYSHKVLNKTSESIKWVNSEIDKQFPGYERKIHEIWEPYGEMFKDVGTLAVNMAGNVQESCVERFGVISVKAPVLLGQARDGIKSALSRTGIDILSYNIAGNVTEAFVGGFGIIADKINTWAPGLLEQTRDGINSALSTTATYIRKSITYLREEVFTGNLAPENMGKVVIQALNTLQERVNGYYVWAYEKVRTVIK